MESANKLIDLTNEEIRVLGVLIEKEKTTPDNYPLTLNSILLGCNQSTNRHPVVNYDEMIVERALGKLRDRGLALRGVYAGSRVPKHRHHLENVFNVSEGAKAVLAVLLLRGAQTLGEIKTRCERLFVFSSLEECDNAIDELVKNKPSLVVRLERQPGQKEARINHTFGDRKISENQMSTKPSLQLIEGEGKDLISSIGDDFEAEDDDVLLRIDHLESEVAVLTHELMALRAEVDNMRDPSA